MKKNIPETEIASTDLAKEEYIRYSRHLILPEVGEEGQRKLKGAKVLIIGAGGLGSPAAFYLAAAGVGTIGIADFDNVELVNLQRQIIHGTGDIGHSKVDSAAGKMRALNPLIKIVKISERLSSENALQLIKDYDVVVDGTDNFPTRYLLNDACVLSGKPYVYGSIFRFEGQASVFATEKGPCYRCLYPEPPPPNLVPSCAEGGVLGILPGIIGSIQATEAIKLVLDIGESLAGQLLLFDALRMEFNKLKIHKNEDCPVCGKNPSVTELIDYDQFCGITADAADNLNITPLQLKQKMDNGDDILLLDVREQIEYKINRIEGGQLIPLYLIPLKMNELDRSKEIIIYCKNGNRSMDALRNLKEAGFDRVKNLAGGINAWIDQVDPKMPRY
jgi:molybdopterin/thiamine biosynthesis adenylyltransferase/rhodanese-related sulfurtransferase